MSDWGQDAVEASSEAEFVARRAERLAQNMAAAYTAMTMSIEQVGEAFVALGDALKAIQLEPEE